MVLDQRKQRHVVRLNDGATVSHERSGAPVTMAAAARQNVALPLLKWWCKRVGKVEEVVVDL